LLVSDQLGDRPVGLDRYWWLRGVNRRLDEVDVFHGTDFSVPYFKRRPAVLMIHDLSPWRFAEASDRVRLRVPWLVRLRRYTLILTPSEAVRREVVAHFGVPESEVVAVPLAASELFQPVPGPRGRYFLCVGTIEPRKNLATLLAAFRLVRESDPDNELLVVGREAVPSLPAAGVQYLGAVPDAELPALYSRARAVCYPSLYEGFGLPVLEALQCGATVITSRDAAVCETGGEATIQVEALEVRAWAAAMLQARPDPERSIRRAAEFSWARTARLTREVYAEAMRRG